MTTYSYIYLLQPREFLVQDIHIYKIGKTTQPNFSRFNNYPVGSKLIFISECNNCDLCEKEIIKLFKEKYHHMAKIGNEYFYGNYIEMIDDIYKIIKKNKSILNEKDIYNPDKLKLLNEKYGIDTKINDKDDDNKDNAIKDYAKVDDTNQDNVNEDDAIKDDAKEDYAKEDDAIKDYAKEDDAIKDDAIKDNAIEDDNLYDKDDKDSKDDDSNSNYNINNKEYICNVCNKSYASYQSLWLHKNKFHPDKIVQEKNDKTEKINNGRHYTCNVCNKVYSNKQSKYMHQKKCKGNTIDTLNKKIIELINKLDKS